MAPTIDRDTALDIINALRRGTVPAQGLHHLAVGIDLEIKTIQEQLEYVRSGRGDFKFIRGAYGAGKTFLASLALESALDQKFVVSQVVISVDTPLHKLDRVYFRIITNLRTRGHEGAALKGLIDQWLFRVEDRVMELEDYEENDPELIERVDREIESDLGEIAKYNSRFSAILRAYYRAQIEGDYSSAQGLLGWLAGEEGIAYSIKKLANVTGDIDNTTALDFLKGITHISRLTGFSGLAIVLDEVETIQRLRTKQIREQCLNNLRQIVDAITAGQFPFTYFLFTGTPDFFESRRGILALEPLHQRIKLENPDDPYLNPRQPQMVLEPFDKEKLNTVAFKVRDIYEQAYGAIDRGRVSEQFILSMIEKITGKFGGEISVVPRIFLREFVDVLDKVEQHPEYNPQKVYDFDVDQIKSQIELLPEEESKVEAINF